MTEIAEAINGLASTIGWCEFWFILLSGASISRRSD
jgi:hypothetical protein